MLLEPDEKVSLAKKDTGHILFHVLLGIGV
jgi:hypothetical protein